MTEGVHFLPLAIGDSGDCAPILCVFVKCLKLGSMILGFSAVVFCLLSGLKPFSALVPMTILLS